MNLRELALQEAQLTLKLASMKLALTAIRESIQKKLDEAAEENGTRQIDVTLPDGTRVGTIGLNDDSRRAVITDEKAFKDWVSEHHPEEIKPAFVREVRPAFQKLILGEIEKNGTPETNDPQTGEISTIPGVEITTVRKGGHSLRWKDGDQSKDAVRNAPAS